MVVESPGDAFALLGNDTRIGILRALAEASTRGFGERTLSFSEVYERVDVGDTDQLSYHFDELAGRFVRKHDVGQDFRYAGWKVVRANRAGTFLGGPCRTFDAPGTCYACGESALRARTGDDRLVVRCGACGTRHTATPLTPDARGPRPRGGPPGVRHGGPPPRLVRGRPDLSGVQRRSGAVGRG